MLCVGVAGGRWVGGRVSCTDSLLLINVFLKKICSCLGQYVLGDLSTHYHYGICKVDAASVGFGFGLLFLFSLFVLLFLFLYLTLWEIAIATTFSGVYVNA